MLYQVRDQTRHVFINESNPTRLRRPEKSACAGARRGMAASVWCAYLPTCLLCCAFSSVGRSGCT